MALTTGHDNTDLGPSSLAAAGRVDSTWTRLMGAGTTLVVAVDKNAGHSGAEMADKIDEAAR